MLCMHCRCSFDIWTSPEDGPIRTETCSDNKIAMLSRWSQLNVERTIDPQEGRTECNFHFHSCFTLLCHGDLDARLRGEEHLNHYADSFNLAGHTRDFTASWSRGKTVDTVAKATCWSTGFDFRQGQRLFSSTPALGPTQPSVQWVPGLFSRAKADGAWSWPLITIHTFPLLTLLLYRCDSCENRLWGWHLDKRGFWRRSVALTYPCLMWTWILYIHFNGWIEIEGDLKRSTLLRIVVFILFSLLLLFRAVFWGILPCKMIVELIPDDGGSTHLWNVGRQSFYTAV
jgi:hypothetical protein